MANSEAGTNTSDDGRVTGQQWYWTTLSAMASYLDAGSIVAIAAGLALWTDYFQLSNTAIGLLAALGPNAIGAAVAPRPRQHPGDDRRAHDIAYTDSETPEV